MTVQQVNTLVQANHILVLAANETVLKKINPGKWIGGTIPYFMDVEGGCMNKDKVFVTDLTQTVSDVKICQYNPNNLSYITNDRFRNGFSWLLLPGFSAIHSRFALDVNDYPGIFDSPLMGWITGVDLAELGSSIPQVMNGTTGQLFDNEAIAIHCQLPDSQYANLQIINLFEQGDGDVISFIDDGFSCTNCLVDGKVVNMAEYIKANGIDTRLPLVANYSGAMINISIQQVEDQKVTFYAPVVKKQEYKFAKPLTNYVEEFKQMIPGDTTSVVGSCNCILNYLYSELEGKKTGMLTGPFTFGEIAYVLVNQTLAMLTVEDVR